MNWIYDEQTEYSRLMVGYDRYGITIREWSENSEADEADDTPFVVSERFATWADYRKRVRCYGGDTGEGRMKARIVAGAISLMTYYGGDSDNSGQVPDLRTYVNGLHEFRC